MASSFAIEVPGEANPLTESLLIHILRAASSSVPHQIQTGTKQLQQWEKSPRFYVHLQSAYLDRRLPLETRYLAIIQLKNGIEKYWRKTALNAVSKEDKAAIRSRLVQSAIEEPDNRLALQNSLVIAKIARFEFPHDWPQALSSVLDSLRHGIQSSDSRTIARSLLLLLQITKELSTGRLQRTKQTLQQATGEIVHVVGDYYASNISSIVQALKEDGSRDLSHDLQNTLLAIKLTRRLLVFGYEYPNRESDVSHFWGISISCLGELINLTKPQVIPAPNTLLIERHMLQLSKLHHEMAKDHPAAFILLPNSIDLVLSYWNTISEFGQSYGSREAVISAVDEPQIGAGGDAIERTALEKFALRGLLIMRACVRMVHQSTHTFKYRKPDDKAEQAQAIDLVRTKVLSDGLVREMMETVVTRFFVFRATDLQQWEEEPEEWEKREEAEGEDWEFSIRPCAEKLFLDLSINYKEIIVQPLLGVFHSVAVPTNEDILLKDSIYTAVGLAAPVLLEQLDFDSFIKNTLVHEVQTTKPGYNILRRRTAILLGQWITIKVGEQMKPVVYQIFQHLLTKDGQPLNDQVVRVTAGRQFKNIVDDWNFTAEPFMPYAEPILTSLMLLIGEVELVETKLALLNTISLIVERLEHHISPFAEGIIGLLPPLWEQSNDEHLMRQSILTILARLVNAMKAGSLPFHAMVIPIIRGAISPDSDSHIYLLEDALELWANIVTQTPTGSASEQLLELSWHLRAILELGSESLRKALEIAESYVLLAPEHMLSAKMQAEILTSMAALIGTLKPEANGLVFVLLEAMIRAAEKQAPSQTGVKDLLSNFHSSGVMTKLVTGLRGSWQAHCTTGPLAQAPPVDGIVETDYFAVLARLILADAGLTCQAIAAAASHESNDLATTMKWLLEEWFSHFENIGDPSRRKLMCLALTKLLDTDQPWILVQLQSLMNMWTDLLREIYEEGQDIAGSDSLVINQNPTIDGPTSPEDQRRKAMTLSDPVYTVSMSEWVKFYLQNAVAKQPKFQDDWIVNVDREVLNGFSSLGLM